MLFSVPDIRAQLNCILWSLVHTYTVYYTQYVRAAQYILYNNSMCTALQHTTESSARPDGNSFCSATYVASATAHTILHLYTTTFPTPTPTVAHTLLPLLPHTPPIYLTIPPTLHHPPLPPLLLPPPSPLHYPPHLHTTTLHT